MLSLDVTAVSGGLAARAAINTTQYTSQKGSNKEYSLLSPNHASVQQRTTSQSDYSSNNSSSNNSSSKNSSSKMPKYHNDIHADKASLMEKLREHYQTGYSTAGGTSKYGFRVLFQFQVITQLYTTLNLIIPFLFSDLHPDTQYYLKVLTCYVFAMGEANWVCAICYSCELPDFRDRPDPDFGIWSQSPPRDAILQNGNLATLLPHKDRNGLEWKYCTRCQRYKPPRAHHCKMCGTCILRRDHHCYLIGTCIGHFNQRYFIALLFYGVIASVAGSILSIRYLSYLPDAGGWYDYIFPVTLFQFCAGNVSWQFCLLAFHVFMLTIFGSMAALYFTGQILLVSSGFTLYEIAKQVDVKVSSTYWENLRLVFGDYWALSFLFPSQILFKQRNDGTSFEGVRIGSGKLSTE
ncbi:uncharacterized protein LOC101855015 [Aplysia californica]|uniref:Palmitoyltransferase n=1 Tax=Aplysia californica TaxID=6500 RepID=A0ABM0JM17_APLCA|nr:uncharacterized protein LOC101855015 [Aplysia californica]